MTNSRYTRRFSTLYDWGCAAAIAAVLLLPPPTQAANASTSQQLTIQNSIDKYELLQEASFPWAHNAYNSTAHGATSFFNNQTISVTAQLNAGQRLIDLDPQVTNVLLLVPGSGVIRLCHNFCVGTEQLLAHRLQDIKNWFNADPSRYETEVVIVNLETYNHNMWSIWGYKYNLAVDAINSTIGNDVYKPHYRCHEFDDLARHLTKADILATGKNIILFGAGADGQGSGGDRASCSSTYGNWGLWVFNVDYNNGPLIDYGSLSGYPSCGGGGFVGQARFSYAYNDIFTGGGGGTDMSLTEMKKLVGCGVNGVSYEAFQANSDQHETLVWSWAPNQPNGLSIDDCAKHAPTGLFWDQNCGETMPYACRNMNDDSWQITSVWAGPWSDGAIACYDEFGHEYEFGVPTNGYHNNRLKSAKAAQGVGDVWVNYYDRDSGNGFDWQPLSQKLIISDWAGGSMCLGLETPGSTANGTKAKLLPCDQTTDTWAYDTEDQLIHASWAYDKCLNVAGNKSTANREIINLHDCGAITEKWHYDRGDRKFHGLWDYDICLNVTGNRSTAIQDIETYRCNDVTETWRFIEPSYTGSRFGSQTRYDWGNGTHNQFSGDFNGDGWDDIGVENSSNGRWYIRYNLGNGQFGNQTIYNWGNGAHNLFAGDFNGDGLDDIGVEDSSIGRWYIRYNLGNGQFGNQTYYNWGNGAHNLFTGDFNGDGYDDIGVLDTNSRTWYIRYNSRANNGQFGSQTEYQWPSGYNIGSSVFGGDFNGDGLADIGFQDTSASTGTWYIRYNKRNGSFGDEISYPWGNYSARNELIGDFDNDGLDDLGVERTSDGAWYIHYGQY